MTYHEENDRAMTNPSRIWALLDAKDHVRATELTHQAAEQLIAGYRIRGGPDIHALRVVEYVVADSEQADLRIAVKFLIERCAEITRELDSVEAERVALQRQAIELLERVRELEARLS